MIIRNPKEALLTLAVVLILWSCLVYGLVQLIARQAGW